jgi:hypothetical protein
VAIDPQHTLHITDVATAIDEQVGAQTEVVALECRDNILIARGPIVGLHSTEENGHRPKGLYLTVAKTSIRLGMFYGITDTTLTFLDESGVVNEVAQTQQAIGIIGRLLVAPPVFGIGVLVDTRDVAGPETGVIRIGHGFGMTGETITLSEQKLLQPSLGRDALDKSLMINTIVL